ncbi:uncharacterized protein LOC116425288 [Nomia melanderi]|uniref:uncharacterized protein LOC116425288 n=1 Tax=Nomia melanderi TaxID=2448451 RepID=UPI0013044B2E|nr:uncharacterized protein LOC116425288 [Nomia melanderi]
MRATVLCLLGLAGAVCALQLPSLLPPKSLVNAGSSLLNGNIPNLNPVPSKKPDQSDQSSSSEEDDDKQTLKLADDLTKRLIKVVQNGLGTMKSTAELPFKIGFGLVNSLVTETQNWMKETIPVFQKDAQQTFSLSLQLANSIVRDIIRSIENVGYNLAHGFLVTEDLKRNINADVARWLKDILSPPARQSGKSSNHNENSDETNSRQRRGLGDILSGVASGFGQLLNASPIGNLAAALSSVDFSQITEPIPQIEEPADVNDLADLPGLKDKIQQARNLTTQTLSPGEEDLPAAIQSALNNAVQSENPVGNIFNLERNILAIYNNEANSSPVPEVSDAINQEGLQLVKESIDSLLSVLSQDVQDLVKSILD